MLRFAQCLAGVGIFLSLTGCQLFSGAKTNSEWTVLQAADEAKCVDWPLGPKDLQMSDVKLVRVSRPSHAGFVATGVSRDGSPLYYYLPFEDDADLERDALVSLKLSRGSVLVGGSNLGKDPVVAVMRNQDDKSTFELRSVKDNVMKFSAAMTEMPISEGGLVTVDGGGWLHFRRDDGEVRYAFIDWEKPTKIEAKNFRAIAFESQPLTLPKADKSGVLTLWREEKSERRFKMRHLGRDGKATEPVVLDVKIEGEVESWTAVAHGQGFYIAYVEGDSLVGQAVLRVAYFNWREDGPAVQWQKEQVIKDIHVGEPVFAQASVGNLTSSKSDLELLLLNWVDDESTIARYKVSTATLGQPRFSGVFARGARVADAFTSADGSDVFALMRYREDNRWSFKVCEL